MKYIKSPFNIFKSIFKIEDDPNIIAKGFALGSFIGMIPIPGFQMIVSLGIASLIKVNKKAACVGVFNTNLATGLFIFAFNYWLGKTILGVSPNFEFPTKLGFGFIFEILEAGSDVFLSLIVGGIITGVFSAISAFYLIRYLLIKKAMV